MSASEIAARYFVCDYPAILLLVYLVALLTAPLPARMPYLLRAALALFVATLLAHVNRIFGLWPAHLLFPSGHTTFCGGLTWSLAMLRPRSLFFTVPLLALLAANLVLLRFHTTLDVIGAVPLVVAIYGPIHAWWRLPADFAPLDSTSVSS